MKSTHESLWIAAVAIASVLIATPVFASGKTQQVVIEARLVDGTRAPSSISVAFHDATGAEGTCEFKGAGTFVCPAIDKIPPFLFRSYDGVQPLFSYAVFVTPGVLVPLNSLTDLDTDQAFQAAFNKSAADEWSLSAPDVLTLPGLASVVAATDRMLLKPTIDYNLSTSAALEFNTFGAKYPSGINNLLSGLSFDGIGQPTETISATLPSGSIFSGSVTALPTIGASTFSWYVQGPSGAKTSQYAFAYYPTQSDAPTVYAASGTLFGDFGNILSKAKNNLIDTNIVPFLYAGNGPTLPSYLNNGDDASIQSEIDATRLRNIRFNGYVLGPIAKFDQNYLGPGLDRIVINALRLSTIKGVPCIDDCCYPIIYDPSAARAYFFGNQLNGGFFQNFVSETDYSSSGINSSRYLKAGGLAPTGTLDPTIGYRISDLDGIYQSTQDIPFIDAKIKTVLPTPKSKPLSLSYDFYDLRTPYDAPVPLDKFMITLTPPSGSSLLPQSLRTYTPSSTNEKFNLDSPTSFTPSNFFGKTVKFSYTLPQSFVVNREFADGVECNSNGDSKPLSPSPSLPSPSATGVSFKTDSAFNNFDVTGSVYRIGFEPLDGPTVLGVIQVGIGCKF